MTQETSNRLRSVEIQQAIYDAASTSQSYMAMRLIRRSVVNGASGYIVVEQRFDHTMPGTHIVTLVVVKISGEPPYARWVEGNSIMLSVFQEEETEEQQ